MCVWEPGRIASARPSCAQRKGRSPVDRDLDHAVQLIPAGQVVYHGVLSPNPGRDHRDLDLTRGTHGQELRRYPR
jgi:hypothetical protein